MKRILRKWAPRVRNCRKGASTMEFVTLVPAFMILCFIVWQVILAGQAVLATHAAVRDAVRVASAGGGDSKDQALKSFGKHEQFKLENFRITTSGGTVKASGGTYIPIIFAKSSPIYYSTDAEAPKLGENKHYSYGYGNGTWVDDGVANPGGYGLMSMMSGTPTGKMGDLITSGGMFGPPVKGARFTSSFGARVDPVTGRPGAFHGGIDLAAPVGTPIYSVADGVVVKAGPARGYGNWIVVDHGGGIQTLYAHMYSDQIYVRPGQKVKRGEHIAGMGSAGKSTGSHLHFEVIANGQKINPQQFLSK
ncbi:peptidoglycan DD-metalloendopeptidase family protein [Hazenella coriacea]|uniref:Peptidase M23-like protein n=1 Tax=Hazenella coriacea TaxID=1179467 RepID=A0A4R3L3M4_9BACL|nr:peptidoglycan DD-metalloendopeptidase family protein [Hazenella coriacea]TCS94253.1 peptidase M23-like protein [Hazenella coriacea]